jgi:hypothetical protein
VLSHRTPAIYSIDDETRRAPVAKYFKGEIIVGSTNSGESAQVAFGSRLSHSAILARVSDLPESGHWRLSFHATQHSSGFIYSDNPVRYRMTTYVLTPMKAVNPMENKSSACLVLNWRPPALSCQPGVFANWQDSATSQ